MTLAVVSVLSIVNPVLPLCDVRLAELTSSPAGGVQDSNLIGELEQYSKVIEPILFVVASSNLIRWLVMAEGVPEVKIIERFWFISADVRPADNR